MKPVELTLFGSEEAEHYASPAVTNTSEDASRIATIVTNEPQPESGSKDGPIRPEGDPTFHQPEPIEKEWRWTKDARETLRLARKILLVPGQSTPDPRLDAVVRQWLRDPRVVVLAEPVSNLLNGATTIDSCSFSLSFTLEVLYKYIVSQNSDSSCNAFRISFN